MAKFGVKRARPENNRQAWACADMLTELEVMGDELAAHFEAAQLRTGRRLRLARIMLDGAKDDTSRRIAHRVVKDWFGQGDLPKRRADVAGVDGTPKGTKTNQNEPPTELIPMELICELAP